MKFRNFQSLKIFKTLEFKFSWSLDFSLSQSFIKRKKPRKTAEKFAHKPREPSKINQNKKGDACSLQQIETISL